MIDKKIIQSAEHLLDLAFEEDLKAGDITTNNLIAQSEVRKAFWRAKEDGVVVGLPIAEMAFRRLDSDLQWTPLVHDGDSVKKGDILVQFSASYRAILSAERIALNFVQRLSGIATETQKYVKEVAHTSTQILDTRKTLPAYRLLDKYAVKMGGGTNHRIGLYDMVMIKDNHIDIAGGITQAVQEIRAKVPNDIKIEVETTNIIDVEEAVLAGADIIMLDNMSNEQMAEAVRYIAGRAKTEASGNMNLQRLSDVAATGVDFISVGALTHSVMALDISQRIEK
ncbi:MAG: carboxylating nicotinate-nucleotide diphosphorylase [Mangrovibacterium sp.]